jgi:hypothetical protein
MSSDVLHGNPAIYNREEMVLAISTNWAYMKGEMLVDAACRYRFYPTPEQAEFLTRTFGCVLI